MAEGNGPRWSSGARATAIGPDQTGAHEQLLQPAASTGKEIAGHRPLVGHSVSGTMALAPLLDEISRRGRVRAKRVGRRLASGHGHVLSPEAVGLGDDGKLGSQPIPLGGPARTGPFCRSGEIRVRRRATP